MMSLMVNSIDIVFLGYFCSMKEVGLYSATFRLICMILSIQPILSGVFLPIITESAALNPDDQKDSELYLKILFFLALPVISGGVLLAEPLTKFFIGKEYVGSGLIFSLMLPNLLFGGLAIYYTDLKLFAVNRTREFVISVTVGAVCNLVLCLVFIPKWGGIASAVIACLSQFVIAGVAAWFSRDIESPSIWRNMIRPILASGIMIVLLLLVTALAPNTHVLLLIVIGATSYGLCWYALKKTLFTHAIEIHIKAAGAKLGSLIQGS
jgi:O-antigen/teichoic acid export membrane protein